MLDVNKIGSEFYWTKKDHFDIFKKIITSIKNININSILDCGSGKTSLGLLKYFFPKANHIDAIVYPGDKRKIDSVHDKFPDFNVLELDITKTRIKEKYDLILAHLLFGESLKFGNILSNMVESYFNIRSKYYIIIDWYEDDSVDFNYIKKYAEENNIKLIYECKLKMTKLASVNEKYKHIKNYYGLLFKKN